MKNSIAPSVLWLALAACVASLPALAAPASSVRPDPDALDTRAAFLRQAADAIRAQARYPASTRVLAADAADPVREPYEVRLGSGLEPLFAWTSSRQVQPGQGIDVHATVEGVDDHGQPLESKRAAQEIHGANVTATIVDDTGAALGRAMLREDARANDGTYSTLYRLPVAANPQPGHARMLTVQVHAVSSDGAVRDSTTALLVSNPGGHLTGQYRDHLENGDLVIDAQVAIESPGRFYLAGTIGDGAGKLVASSHQAQSFASPGIYWMSLPYYGLAFVDRGVKGPMTLQTVALSGANGMPTAFGPLVENAYRTTQTIDPARMNNHPFNDPRKLERAQRLEAQIGASADRPAPLAH